MYDSIAIVRQRLLSVNAILGLYAVFARLGLVDRRQRDKSMALAIINSLSINTRASCEPLQLFPSYNLSVLFTALQRSTECHSLGIYRQPNSEIGK
ncbi:hypothetical protein CI102_4836 [Trichoderma harzianum]|nr:hypothetical protein CI102_4836 [Trichoderma harzianum]